MQQTDPKLIITEKQRDVLLTALRLYAGEFPEAYSGAEFFKEEVTGLIQELPKIKLRHRCGWHPMMECCDVGNLTLESPEEIMAVIRSLEIYTGKFPEAYSGATIWAHEAHLLHQKFLYTFCNEIAHLEQ